MNRIARILTGTAAATALCLISFAGPADAGIKYKSNTDNGIKYSAVRW